DARIARNRNDGRCVGDCAVERWDQRLGEASNVANQRAGHSRELEESIYVAFEQLANYLLDIPARAKASALPSDDNYSHLISSSKRCQRVGQLPIDVKGKRVQPVRPIEGYRRNRALLLISEALWIYAG